jgi:hypothetical protein
VKALALLFALLKSAPTLIAFLQSLHAAAQSKADQGIGYDQAVADALAAAQQGVLALKAAADAATGDDDEFRRD